MQLIRPQFCIEALKAHLARVARVRQQGLLQCGRLKIQKFKLKNVKINICKGQSWLVGHIQRNLAHGSQFGTPCYRLL